MTTICNSIIFEQEDIAANAWSEIVNAQSTVNEINGCELINPMTGDSVSIPSPPNRLAEIVVDGRRVGIMRLPKAGAEIEVHFEEGDGCVVQAVLMETSLTYNVTLR